MAEATAGVVAPSGRKVGAVLGIGIFLLPVIFVWFLLRRGYSPVARIVGFAWLALVLIVAFGAHGQSGSAPTGDPSAGGQAAPAAKRFTVGDAIAYDSGLQAVVTSVKTARQVGMDIAPSTAAAGGTYVIVTYTATNTSSKPIHAYSLPEPKLMDGSGTVYGEDAGATGAYEMAHQDNQKLWSDLNPGITITGAKVFEVSASRYDPATWSVVLNGDKDSPVAIQR